MNNQNIQPDQTEQVLLGLTPEAIAKAPANVQPFLKAIASKAKLKPIAIFDALGFKNASSQLQFHDMYIRFLNTLLNQSISKRANDPGDLQYLFVLDTIVAFPARDQGIEALGPLVSYGAVLIANSLTIPKSFPLRGSISFGSYLADSNHKLNIENEPTPIPSFPVVIGKAAIGAHEWERSQKWVGASIDPDSRELIEKYYPDKLKALIKQHDLIEWDVPTEHGPIRTLAVNFVHAHGVSLLSTALQNFLKNENDRRIKAKYLATMRFFEEMCSKKWFNSTSNK